MSLKNVSKGREGKIPVCKHGQHHLPAPKYDRAPSVPSSRPPRSLGQKGESVPVSEHHWQVSVLSTTGADADLGLGRSSAPSIGPVGPKAAWPRWFVSVVWNAGVYAGCTNCSFSLYTYSIPFSAFLPRPSPFKHKKATVGTGWFKTPSRCPIADTR